MSVTFSDVLPVRQVSSHEYTVNLEDPWCIGTVPNGGYVTSAFMIVARTHMQLTHTKRNQPDVINLHLEFLRRTSTGPATFKVTDVKIGSRISNLHLTLCQPKDTSDPSSPIQDEVQGYLTISNITSEEGPTNDTQYRLRPSPLPASLDLLAKHGEDENYMQRRSDPYGKFRRASHHCQMYLVKPSRRTSDLQTPALVDQWVRFQPISPTTTTTKNAQPQFVPGRWTNDALGYIVDIFPQLHERFVKGDLEDSLLESTTTISDHQIKQLATSKQKSPQTAAFWYPTLLLNLDVKKKLPPEGVEWLFVRVLAKKMHQGRFDLQVEVWDDPINGELVALSSHASLIVDASRNMKRDKTSSSSPLPASANTPARNNGSKI